MYLKNAIKSDIVFVASLTTSSGDFCCYFRTTLYQGKTTHYQWSEKDLLCKSRSLDVFNVTGGEGQTEVWPTSLEGSYASSFSKQYLGTAFLRL